MPDDPLLAERHKTHGDFAMNAMYAQQIKRIFHSAPCWNHLHDGHKEALHMIALKLSRVLGGHEDFRDHWDDIAGYAKLGSQICGRRGPSDVHNGP